MSEARFWLLKTEPDVYSIDDLARDRQTAWEGVRNYQARNSMRDGMRLGDLALVYHSNASPPGVAGVARICREAYPDPTQFDSTSKYFDPGSKAADPRWLRVDIAFVEKLPRVVGLDELKAAPELAGLEVARKGSRLSVTPVSPEHFQRIVAMARG